MAPELPGADPGDGCDLHFRVYPSPRAFENAFGRFRYRNIRGEPFFGFTPREIGGERVLAADPENVLLDTWHLEHDEWNPKRLWQMLFQRLELIDLRTLSDHAKRFDYPRIWRALEARQRWSRRRTARCETGSSVSRGFRVGLHRRLNVLREYVQSFVPRPLHKSKTFRCLWSLGGAPLRFLHALARYSEDPRFSLLRAEACEPGRWIPPQNAYHLFRS